MKAARKRLTRSDCDSGSDSDSDEVSAFFILKNSTLNTPESQLL